RIAVLDDVDADGESSPQSHQHYRADQREDRAVENRPRPHELEARTLPGEPALDVGFGVIGDEPSRQSDLDHDVVASVDAQRAIDAFELGTIADVDSHRARRDALAAIDAIRGRGPWRALAMRPARLAPIAPIGNGERLAVGHGRLDARPGAHIGADLLAHQ